MVGINENFCHCINRGIAEANYKTEKSLLEPTGYLSPTTRPSTKYYAQMIILHERLPLQSRHYKVFGHNSDDLLERSRYGKRRNIRQTKTVIIVKYLKMNLRLQNFWVRKWHKGIVIQKEKKGNIRDKVRLIFLHMRPDFEEVI